MNNNEIINNVMYLARLKSGEIEVNVYGRDEVKKMLLQYHNLDGNEKLIGIEGVRKIMKRLGSIQYDPLNVVGRNADLVLQARVEGYRPEHLYSGIELCWRKFLTFPIDGKCIRLSQKESMVIM